MVVSLILLEIVFLVGEIMEGNLVGFPFFDFLKTCTNVARSCNYFGGPSVPTKSTFEKGDEAGTRLLEHGQIVTG